MTVDDVMKRDVKTCRPSDSLNRAAQIMWDHDCGCVPVVNEKNEVIGMLTDRDICMAAYTQGRVLAEITVDNVMSTQVFACAAGDSLTAAEAIMQTHQIRRLPVLGFENQLLGILSLNDLALAVASSPRDQSSGLSAAAIESTLAAVCRPRGEQLS